MMMEKVGNLMRAAAAAFVLPRYRALRSGDIEDKGGAEIVTIVDREVEAWLTAQLTGLLPGSRVVGEEAVAVQPALYDALLGQEKVWLVDPLDGTGNFVQGTPCFSIMVALVEQGRTVACWMLDPLSDSLAVSQRGGGAFLAGARVVAPQGRPDRLQGAIFKRYLPAAVRADIERREGDVGTLLPGLMCAGHEYPAIATGQRDFAVFWRSEPWDHAPGTLFLEEAGGTAARFDGSRYRPADRGHGLLAAASPEIWDAVQAGLGLR